jgi:hypothetical protein
MAQANAIPLSIRSAVRLMSGFMTSLFPDPGRTAAPPVHHRRGAAFAISSVPLERQMWHRLHICGGAL